ncbi:MAG: helix-turn-helix domain-containing protein, partial [Abditibacteriota bacterium]|nr:helix-turn-helix domain-containing protein [Abditibacteriota bacterium]MBR4750031.1 helix-turn-helix domain-containing protein [Abditibacteriota bacterium]
MNYKHLTIEERCCIRKYLLEGLSLRKIALLIGRSASTV